MVATKVKRKTIDDKIRELQARKAVADKKAELKARIEAAKKELKTLRK